jgi:peptidoglycan/xylan/chitin deacetylase (PgdA/CDA1 family)
LLAWIILVVSIMVFLYAGVPEIYGGFSRLLLARRAVKSNAIVLTFDDGPGSKLTPELLRILQDNKVKATFFLLGRNIAGREEIVRQIVEQGHDIYSHGYDHLHGWKVSPFRALADIKQGWAAIDTALESRRQKYPFRPPNGKLNVVCLLYLLFRNVPVVYWSVDSGDTWRRKPDSHRVAQLLERTGGAVSLAHDFDRKNEDTNRFVIESVRAALAMAADKGIRVLTVSELLGIDR